MKISFVIGDSLTIPRAFANPPQLLQDIYPYKLDEWLRASGHLLYRVPLQREHRISDMMDNLNRELECLGKQDYSTAIIHLGVVDCAPRPLPYILGKAIDSSPKHIKRASLHVVGKVRPFSQHVHYWQFTPARRFERYYEQLLTVCHKAFNRTIAVNIAAVPSEVEAYSPGFHNEVERYNAIIAKLTRQRALLLDVYAYTSNYTNSRVTSDLHLTEISHQWIYEQVKTIMES